MCYALVGCAELDVFREGPGRRDLLLYSGFFGRDSRGLVPQWLAAQVVGDVAGFADGGRDGFGMAQAGEIPA
jgi:hypothetical protein